jgi:hypothetical protein
VVFVVFFALFYFILIAADLLSNFIYDCKEKYLSKWCLWNFFCLFCKDDPLSYRIEIYSYLFLIFYYLIFQIIYQIVSRTIDPFQNFPSVVYAIFQTILYMLFISFIIIFPLIITIYYLIRDIILLIYYKIKGKKKIEIIDEILQNKKTFILFKDFAQKEW